MKTNALKLATLNVIVKNVLYNLAAALHILNQAGPTTATACLEKWFAATDVESRLPCVRDKKLNIVALCKLVAIPESLQAVFPGVVSGACNLFQESSGPFGVSLSLNSQECE